MSYLTRRILHADLDAFFVAVERSLDPGLEGKPVVVGAKSGTRGVVTCASYEARAYGLRAGMPVYEARRLCPNAVYIGGNFTRYKAVSKLFMNILNDYTPFLEPVGIDEAYMDMTGFDDLYGPLNSVAMDIKSRVFTELGVTVSIGIASSKITAKVASDYCKPNGLLELPIGGDASFLAPLPIERLPGVGKKTAKILKGFQIITIGDLALLASSPLRRLVGAWGDTLSVNARGEDKNSVSTASATKSISKETTFYGNILDMDSLSGTLHHLSEVVGANLRKKKKVARRVCLKLRYADFETITRNYTLTRSTDCDQDILRIGLSMMIKAIEKRSDPVRLLGIGVSDITPWSSQLSFLDDWNVQRGNLDLAVDAIREKYGFRSIQRGLTFSTGQGLDMKKIEYLLTPKFSC